MESKEKIFYLYRHGETDWNANGKVKGQEENINTKLTPLGIEQMNKVKENIISNGIDAIFTSDLKRTCECSSIINEGLNLPIHHLKNFRGLDTGLFIGKDVNEFRRNPDVQEAFRNYNKPIPGGESINNFLGRIIEGLNIISTNYDYNKVAIMTHVTTISNIKLFLAKTPYEDIDYCTIRLSNNNYEIIDYGHYEDNKIKIYRR